MPALKTLIVDPADNRTIVKSFSSRKELLATVFPDDVVLLEEQMIGGAGFVIASAAASSETGIPIIIDDEMHIHVRGRIAVVAAADGHPGLSNSDIGHLMKYIRTAKEPFPSNREHVVLLADLYQGNPHVQSRLPAQNKEAIRKQRASRILPKKPPSNNNSGRVVPMLKDVILQDYRRISRYRKILAAASDYDALSIDQRIAYFRMLEWLASTDRNFSSLSEQEMLSILKKKVAAMDLAIDNAAAKAGDSYKHDLKESLIRNLENGVPMSSLPVSISALRKYKEMAVKVAAEHWPVKESHDNFCC